MADENDTSSLDSQVELRGDSEQFDLAVYTAAATFNAVAFPPNMPEEVKQEIEARAERARQANPNINFATDDPSGVEAKKKREADADDRADLQLSLILQEQQREREAWMRTPSTVGGVTMTGEEWSELSKRLRSDDDLRARIMDAFMRRGMTEAEAERRCDRVADIAEIMALPPAQRTEEQQAKVEKADADPTFKQDVRDVERLSSDYDAPSPEAPFKLNEEFSGAATGAALEAKHQPATPIAPTKVVSIDASPI